MPTGSKSSTKQRQTSKRAKLSSLSVNPNKPQTTAQVSTN